MKKMKKIVPVAILVLLVSLVVAGCSCSPVDVKEEYVNEEVNNIDIGADNIGKVSEADAALMAGTWNLVAGEANGQKVTADQIGSKQSFEFKKDGTVVYTLDGQSETYKWTKDGEAITIWIPEQNGYDSSNIAILEGGAFTLYWNYNGQPVKMIFAQPGTQAADPSNYV